MGGGGIFPGTPAKKPQWTEVCMQVCIHITMVSFTS